jgi:secreted trypsin-like serine protease
MYGNDIALIRIVPEGAPSPRDLTRIRPIPLNRAPLAGGTPVSATGWGAVGAGEAQTASATILRVDLRLMDTPVCQARPAYGPLKVHERVFCAAHPTRSTCRGDSGGPVVLTNGAPVLVGLVSWGKKKCAGDGRPGVYTRVDRYLAWIEQAMKLPPGRSALP